MKKIIFFLIVILAMFSCFDPEPQDSRTEYAIKNTSTHNVKLKLFNAYFDYVFKDTTFLFSPNSEFAYAYINNSGSPFGGAVDSAHIIFDNVRQIKYRHGDGKVRNILDINSYEGGLVKGEWYKYQYYITDEDYANAIIIK